MRWKSIVVGAALIAAAPAQAQFGVPIGGGEPWIFAAPGVANGVIGSGAANNAVNSQRCPVTAGGRGGPPQYQCPPTPGATPHGR